MGSGRHVSCNWMYMYVLMASLMSKFTFMCQRAWCSMLLIAFEVLVLKSVQVVYKGQVPEGDVFGVCAPQVFIAQIMSMLKLACSHIGHQFIAKVRLLEVSTTHLV